MTPTQADIKAAQEIDKLIEIGNDGCGPGPEDMAEIIATAIQPEREAKDSEMAKLKEALMPFSKLHSIDIQLAKKLLK